MDHSNVYKPLKVESINDELLFLTAVNEGASHTFIQYDYTVSNILKLIITLSRQDKSVIQSSINNLFIELNKSENIHLLFNAIQQRATQWLLDMGEITSYLLLSESYFIAELVDQRRFYDAAVGFKEKNLIFNEKSEHTITITNPNKCRATVNIFYQPSDQNDQSFQVVIQPSTFYIGKYFQSKKQVTVTILYSSSSPPNPQSILLQVELYTKYRHSKDHNVHSNTLNASVSSSTSHYAQSAPPTNQPSTNSSTSTSGSSISHKEYSSISHGTSTSSPTTKRAPFRKASIAAVTSLSPRRNKVEQSSFSHMDNPSQLSKVTSGSSIYSSNLPSSATSSQNYTSNPANQAKPINRHFIVMKFSINNQQKISTQTIQILPSRFTFVNNLATYLPRILINELNQLAQRASANTTNIISQKDKEKYQNSILKNPDTKYLIQLKTQNMNDVAAFKSSKRQANLFPKGTPPRVSPTKPIGGGIPTSTKGGVESSKTDDAIPSPSSSKPKKSLAMSSDLRHLKREKLTLKNEEETREKLKLSRELELELNNSPKQQQQQEEEEVEEKHQQHGEEEGKGKNKNFVPPKFTRSYCQDDLSMHVNKSEMRKGAGAGAYASERRGEEEIISPRGMLSPRDRERERISPREGSHEKGKLNKTRIEGMKQLKELKEGKFNDIASFKNFVKSKANEESSTDEIEEKQIRKSATRSSKWQDEEAAHQTRTRSTAISTPATNKAKGSVVVSAGGSLIKESVAKNIILTPKYQEFDAAILFIDISGFTSLNEKLAELGAVGPETVSKHINNYFTQLIDMVNKHGGDTLKFAGDALICMFGSPFNHEAKEEEEQHDSDDDSDSNEEEDEEEKKDQTAERKENKEKEKEEEEEEEEDEEAEKEEEKKEIVNELRRSLLSTEGLHREGSSGSLVGRRFSDDTSGLTKSLPGVSFSNAVRRHSVETGGPETSTGHTIGIKSSSRERLASTNTANAMKHQMTNRNRKLSDAAEFNMQMLRDKRNKLRKETRKAVECALDIQTILGKYDSNQGFTLTLHVGIGAGKIYALYIGGVNNSWEFLITGEPLAQLRTCVELSNAGEVVVSEKVWKLIKNYFHGELIKDSENNDYYVTSIKKPLNCSISNTNKNNQEVAVKLNSSMEEIARYFIPKAVQVQYDSGQMDCWTDELRVVTVLFVKLNTIIPTEPINQYCKKLQQLLVIMQTEILQYQGMVRQFLADDKGIVLIAAFGVPPYSHIDGALRGVRAGISIHMKLKQYESMDNSIGITTGPVFCGAVGSLARREYAMVGDIVNLSARLMVYAYKMNLRVLTDKTTADGCQGKLNLNLIDSIDVKGKKNKVQIYQPASFSITNSRILSSQLQKDMNSANKLKIYGRDDILNLFKSLLNSRLYHFESPVPLSIQFISNNPSNPSTSTPSNATNASILSQSTNPGGGTTNPLQMNLNQVNNQANTQIITPRNHQTGNVTLGKAGGVVAQLNFGQPQQPGAGGTLGQAGVGNSGINNDNNNCTNVNNNNHINQNPLLPAGKIPIYIIEGEAGFGKSLLASKIFEYGNQSKIQCFYSICDSIAMNSSFFFWRPIVNELLDGVNCGVSLYSSTILPSNHLTKYIMFENAKEYCGIEEELLNSLYLLKTIIPSFEIPPEYQSNQFTKKLTQNQENLRIAQILSKFLKVKLKQDAIMFLIEDIQWADDVSIGILMKLHQSLSSYYLSELSSSKRIHKIYFICTMRPIECFSSGIQSSSSRRSIQRFLSSDFIFKIQLPRLSDDNIVSISTSFLNFHHDLPDVILQLLKSAQGNPKDSLDLLRNLIHSNFIRISDDTLLINDISFVFLPSFSLFLSFLFLCFPFSSSSSLLFVFFFNYPSVMVILSPSIAFLPRFFLSLLPCRFSLGYPSSTISFTFL